jgi:WD40 repeat protein
MFENVNLIKSIFNYFRLFTRNKVHATMKNTLLLQILIEIPRNLREKSILPKPDNEIHWLTRDKIGNIVFCTTDARTGGNTSRIHIRDQIIDHISTCFLFLPNNDFVSGSFFGDIRIYAKDNDYKCSHILEGHSDSIYCLIQLSNGNIASGSVDYRVRIWDHQKGQYKCTHVLDNKSHLRYLLQLPNGYLLASQFWVTSMYGILIITSNVLKKSKGISTG